MTSTTYYPEGTRVRLHGERGHITYVQHLGHRDQRYGVKLLGGAQLDGLTAADIEPDDENAIQHRLHDRYGERGGRVGSFGDTVDAVDINLYLSEWLAENPDTSTRPPNPDPTGDDLLDALGLLDAYRREIDWEERHLIAAARRRGIAWDRIGVMLGYKPGSARQSAWARYQKLGGRTDPGDETGGRRE